MSRGYKGVWREGRLVAEYQNGELTFCDHEYWERKRSELKAPMVIRDIGEYRSPIDNTMITSRSHHRDHMRAHDVIEVGNERLTRPPESTAPDIELGRAIKQRVEEVKQMPQETYDAHVRKTLAEHEAVASLATATPAP